MSSAIGEVAKAAVQAGKKVHTWTKSPQGQAAIGSAKMILARRALKKNPANQNARRTSMKGAEQAGKGLGTIAGEQIAKRRR